MFDAEKESAVCLKRLWPRLEPLLPDDETRAIFRARLDRHFPALLPLLVELYGQRYDFFYHLETILTTAAQRVASRPADLGALDRAREAAPQWFHSEQMMGGVCYVDRFAGDLAGLRAKIPYFKELGLTYLHLMPLFKSPEGDNDGGYAVSDYRQVDPVLGTTAELADLAAELRRSGISMALDFVFNHTSDEHAWAMRALAGEEEYQDYYLMFPDRTLPDQYEQNLREIFPEQAPGNFTFRPEIDKWVWTTFHNFQWDLNYANPAVFTAMLGEMLALANVGAEVLRLDAVVFIWKQMGTTCEGLPQVHLIIEAFNLLVKIAAPALVFLSEAIVHPSVVARYVHPARAPISYNPTLMALLWESLATRKTTLLRLSMERHFDLPEGCTWLNYVRCHDDIGWTFADEEAAEIGINGFYHRQFLNQFYTGAFPGSFAKGLPFNFNPHTLDMRISGMCASLAGLEQALELHNDLYRDNALRRIELIHSVILSVGGIPQLYLGDEIGMLNDYGYQDDPDQRGDSRWVHRCRFDWERAADRHDPGTLAGRLFGTLRKWIAIRQQTPALANGVTRFLDVHNEHVLVYLRTRQILVLANFAETPQTVRVGWAPSNPVDLITGQPHTTGLTVDLAPYQAVWLAAGES